MVFGLFSRRVVGWAVADHLSHELALAALDMAIVRRRPTPGLIHHSERGVQFAAHEYRKRLQQHGKARADIFQFLEGWYNRRRLHSALGYLTPDQKVATFNATASAAQHCP